MIIDSLKKITKMNLKFLEIMLAKNENYVRINIKY